MLSCFSNKKAPGRGLTNIHFKMKPRRERLSQLRWNWRLKSIENCLILLNKITGFQIIFPELNRIFGCKFNLPDIKY